MPREADRDARCRDSPSLGHSGADRAADAPRLSRENAAAYCQPCGDCSKVIAQEQSGIVIDALDVLSADDYADALHPNAAGREVYSHFLGRASAPLAGTSQH